jgi:hypothetical protein
MTNAPGRFQPQGVSTTTPGPPVFWRLVASSWLLLLLVGSGGAAWLGFGVLAIIARRRSWGIIAGVYALAAIIVQLPDDPAGRILQGSLYLVALLHGLILNQTWLLLLWGRRENGLNIFGNQPGGNAPPTGPRRRAAAIPKEAEKLLGSGGTARSDYVDDSTPAPAPRKRQTRAQRRAQEAAASGAARPAAQRPPAPTPAAAAARPSADVELVDVNTANQRTIARLTGLDRGLAKAAITERTKRGGFGSLEDFAATAGLQPHEIARLRDEAYCSPRPRAKRSFGRRVDY